MNQYGKSEWDRLSEQERQNQLAKMRMLEKKLRREGKYDELAKLLGDAANDSDALGVRYVFSTLLFPDSCLSRWIWLGSKPSRGVLEGKPFG